MIDTNSAAQRYYEEVVPVMHQRIESDSLLIREMVKVRAYYDGDYMIPTPDLASDSDLPRSTPLLMQEAIDNAARVACSVMFDVAVPIVNRSGWSQDDARGNMNTRRRILAATYEASGFGLLRRRSMRHLAGYATYAMQVIPDIALGMPRYQLLDPLLTYPEPKADDDVSPIMDIGVIRCLSAGKVRQTWPQAMSENGGPVAREGTDELWDIIEWTDPDWYVCGLLGPRQYDAESVYEAYHRGDPSLLLSAYPNRLGRCNAVAPRRVTLSRIASQMAQLTGIVDLLDRLNALDIEATERSIFPDVYITGNEGQPPKLVGGEWYDGRTGRVNLVHNAESVGQLRTAPDPNSKMAADRLERNMRISTGLVPQTGGETYGALRTGRGIDALMSAAVDPRIQEMHEIDQHYQSYLASVTFDTYKAWWGNTKMELFSGWRSDGEVIEVTPNKDIPASHAKAKYPFPGQDVSQTTITLGQLLGTKGISVRTFRRMHPWIEDDVSEGTMIDEEAMEDFALQAIMAQIQSSELPLPYLAKLEKHRRKPGNDIFAAIEAADAELKKEQEALAAQQAEMAQGQVPPAPLQPGLGPMPGGGPPMPMPPEPQVVDPAVQGGVSQANQLLSALESGAA